MPILMAGIDHNRADLDVRSRFSFTRKMMEDAFIWTKRLDPGRGKRGFLRLVRGPGCHPQDSGAKDIAAGNVAARMMPAFRRACLAIDAREHLEHEIESASSRMMNNLLFGMRTRLPEDVFRECLGAMEASLKSWKHN